MKKSPDKKGSGVKGFQNRWRVRKMAREGGYGRKDHHLFSNGESRRKRNRRKKNGEGRYYTLFFFLKKGRKKKRTTVTIRE